MTINELITERITEELDKFDWQDAIKTAIESIDISIIVQQVIADNLDIEYQAEEYIRHRAEDIIDHIDIEDYIMPW